MSRYSIKQKKPANPSRTDLDGNIKEKNVPLQNDISSGITPDKIMQLQKTIGNQAVTHWLRSSNNSRPPSGDVVQAKLKFESGTEYLDASSNNIPYSSYNKVQDKAKKYYDRDLDELTFKTGNPGNAAAHFSPKSDVFINGEIIIKPLEPDQLKSKSYEYNDRLVEVSHETHHAIDHCEDLNLKSDSTRDKVISEFRTFAVQSALTAQIKGADQNISSKYTGFQKSLDPEIQELGDKSENGFAKGNMMYRTIKEYLTQYSGTNYDDSMTENFISDNQNELDRALAIYQSLKNNTEGEHDTYIDTETYEEESEPEDMGDGVSMTTITEKSRKVRKNVS